MIRFHFVYFFDFSAAAISSNGGARQMRTVPSLLPLARCFPLGENASAVTAPLCPRSVAACWKDSKCHNLIVLSSPPVARVRPSDENATAQADPLWAAREMPGWRPPPLKLWRAARSDRLQRRL